MSSQNRVVFDCNVLFQAFLSDRGPAGELLRLVASRQVLLFQSSEALLELQNVLARPHLVARFKYSQESVTSYLDGIRKMANLVDDVPRVFDFPRDPKDAHYIDLAVAAKAYLIVSRDKDLLSLRDMNDSFARQFMQRFPELSILTPPEALTVLRPQPS